MKNKLSLIAGALCALILASAPGAAVAQAPARYDDVVPANAIAVITIPNVSELKQFIASPEFSALLDLTGKRAEILAGFEEFKTQFNQNSGLDLMTIYHGLAGDLTLAITRFDLSEGETGVDVLVLFGMAGGDAEVWSLLRAVSAVAAENQVQAELTQIAGHDVLTFPGDVYLTAAHGHLALVNRPSAVEALFSATPRLRDSAQFARHKELARLQNGIVAYADFTSFKPLIEQAMTTADAPELAENTEAQSLMAAIRAFDLDKLDSFSTQIPFVDNGPVTFFIKAHEYGGVLAKIFSTRPVGLDAAASAPASYDTWMALTINKPIDIFHSMIELARQFNPEMNPEDVEMGLAMAKEATGIDFLTDVFAPLGETLSFGISLDPAKAGSMMENPLVLFQMMEMEFCISLADETTLRATADKILAQAGEYVSVVQHGGGTIYSPNVPGLPLDPSIAIHKGQIRFATFGPERMKQIIDQLEAGDVLAKRPDYQATMRGVAADSWALGYASVDYLNKWADISLAQLPKSEDAEVVAQNERFRAARDMFLAGSTSVPSSMRILPDGFFAETRYSLKTFLYFMALEVSKLQSINWSDDEEEVEVLEDEEVEIEPEEGGR